MINVFLDTSIFLASLRSPQGGSSELLRYAVIGAIEASVSDDVIDEVARHVHEVDPALRSLLLRYLAAIPFRVVSVTPEEVQWAITFTAPKDGAIVAAAHKSGAAYLVTLDKRHLLDKKADIEPNVGFQIVRPEAILSILRQEK
jgi:putative PIN family toxin of toxin-antitoxin system